MTEILPQVHRIEAEFGGRLLACHLLLGERALLIDSGVAATPEQAIFPYLDRIGVPVERIEWLVVTHASGDHFGGNEAIKRRSPRTTIVAHERDAASIANHATFVAEHIACLGAEGVPVPNLNPNDSGFLAVHGAETAVDEVVHGGERLDLGPAWSVRLLHAPGHTPGHLVVHDPRNRALFAGDAVLGEGIPDLGGRVVMPPHYFEVDWYAGTVQAARALAAQHLLATHFSPLAGAEAEAFLQASGAFVSRFESILLDALTEAGRPVEIGDLVPAARARLGIPNSDYQYGLLIRAHLRALAQQGRARSTREGGAPRWTLTG